MREQEYKNKEVSFPEPQFKPGRNCWCVEEASRASIIVDTADYFAAFAATCRAARKQILILGWDFDRRVRLFRDDQERGFPEQIGAFLVDLVKRNNNLNIYLLSWDFNMIYAAEREFLPALRLRMQAPRRFHFRLDDHHPRGASHHQKVVVVDDRVAFVGGVDLSRWRWDTSEHKPDDPRRIDPDGKNYPPFHDLMMVVEGPVAARLGELARERWKRSRGWHVKPVDDSDSSPWPETVKADLHSVPVAIARTQPKFDGGAEIREVEQLYLDGIASARRFIYIENQYFTSRSLAGALSKRLGEENGPEVVLVLAQKTGGWLEQLTMDVLRGRVVAKMQQADKYGRLRIYYPYQPGLGDNCISVHAKLMIVDDRLLRIGSSNTSNRSQGLDTECDLALEVKNPEDSVAVFIRGFRRRLLGEHLDCPVERLAEAEENRKGLIASIKSLQSDGRSLRNLDCTVSKEIDDQVPDSSLIDPTEPFSPDYFIAKFIPEQSRVTGSRRMLRFIALLIVLMALAAVWRWTSLSDWLSPDSLSGLLSAISSPGWRAVAVVGGIALASLLMVPLTLLATVGGVLFQGWQAFAYLLAGSMASAVLGFLGGRLLSKNTIKQIGGPRLAQINRRLGKGGTIAVVVLRMVPVAPFTVFNLVAGASSLGFRPFVLGSLLGLAPGLAAITFFSRTLWEAVTSPSLTTIALAVLIGFTLLGIVWLAKSWLRSG